LRSATLKHPTFISFQKLDTKIKADFEENISVKSFATIQSKTRIKKQLTKTPYRKKSMSMLQVVVHQTKLK